MEKKPSLPAVASEGIRAGLQRIIAKERGQRGAARVLEMAQPSISAIIRGRSEPSYETGVRVARELGVDLGNLLGIESVGEDMGDIFPNRARAVQAARLLDLSEVGILYARACAGPERSPLAWLDLIKAHANDAPSDSGTHALDLPTDKQR